MFWWTFWITTGTNRRWICAGTGICRPYAQLAGYAMLSKLNTRTDLSFLCISHGPKRGNIHKKVITSTMMVRFVWQWNGTSRHWYLHEAFNSVGETPGNYLAIILACLCNSKSTVSQCHTVLWFKMSKTCNVKQTHHISPPMELYASHKNATPPWYRVNVTKYCYISLGVIWIKYPSYIYQSPGNSVLLT